jgi:hypothetical protein
MHYDFLESNGTNRNMITSTIEMFKPDSIGSTFLFVDMNYSLKNSDVKLSYFEIARNFKSRISKFELQLGYNGGNLITENNTGIHINPAFLMGINYPFQIKNVYFNSALLYRYETSPSNSSNVHFTGLWFWNSKSKKIILKGFIDIWTTSSERNLVILSEPQCWYNIKYGYSIGSELELSYGFVKLDKKLYFYPTIALKYTW